MKIAPDLLEEIVAHARRDAPNECCGLIVARGGVAEAVHPLENLQPSPFRFELDTLAMYKIQTAAEDDGAELISVYHSHTRSEPRPSQTDINFGKLHPGLEWLIVGLAGDEPDIRSWTIAPDGQVTEVAVDAG